MTAVYRLRSDVRTRTVRVDVDGETATQAECSACLYTRDVYEVTAEGLPVCSKCWPDVSGEEQCVCCGCILLDNEIADSICSSCGQANEDAEREAQAGWPR